MPAFWYKLTYETESGLTVDMFHIDTTIWIGRSLEARWILGEDFCESQKTWLRAELQNSQADWKVVLGHHPIYSAGSHGATRELVDELEPWVHEYGVDIYVAAHDHSQQLIVYNGTVPLLGTHYVVSGAGGKKMREQRNGYPDGSLKISPGDTGNLGFCEIRFCKSEATLTFYGADGEKRVPPVVIPKLPPFKNLPSMNFGGPVINGPEDPIIQTPSGPMEGNNLGAPCHGVMLDNVDFQCTPCRVITDENGLTSTCGKYCNRNNLTCNRGWDQTSDDANCVVAVSLGCDQHAAVDLMCECGEPSPYAVR